MIDALLRDFTSPVVDLDGSLPKYVELILALTTLSAYEILARETALVDLNQLPESRSLTEAGMYLESAILPQTDTARTLPGHWHCADEQRRRRRSRSMETEEEIDDQMRHQLGVYDDFDSRHQGGLTDTDEEDEMHSESDAPMGDGTAYQRRGMVGGKDYHYGGKEYLGGKEYVGGKDYPQYKEYHGGKDYPQYNIGFLANHPAMNTGKGTAPFCFPQTVLQQHQHHHLSPLVFNASSSVSQSECSSSAVSRMTDGTTDGTNHSSSQVEGGESSCCLSASSTSTSSRCCSESIVDSDPAYRIADGVAFVNSAMMAGVSPAIPGSSPMLSPPPPQSSALQQQIPPIDVPIPLSSSSSPSSSFSSGGTKPFPQPLAQANCGGSDGSWVGADWQIRDGGAAVETVR